MAHMELIRKAIWALRASLLATTDAATMKSLDWLEKLVPCLRQEGGCIL